MNILDLLEVKGFSPVHAGGAEYKMPCPHQAGHSDGFDTNPSFSVNIEKKKAQCWSCGFRMGEVGLTKWLLGEDLDEMTIQAMALKGTIKRANESDSPYIGFITEAEEFTLLPPSTLWDKDYRGIPKEFYQEIGARYCKVGRYENRIIFPIYLHSRLKGFDSRALGNEKPKYLRNKGFDSLNEGLYPFDRVKASKPKYVLICEGIFDALNANYHGFPALCIFGTQAWGMEKFSLVMSLGVTEIVLALDNDKAGEKCATAIAEMCKDWLKVSYLDSTFLVDGRDLGDLTKEEITLSLERRTK